MWKVSLLVLLSGLESHLSDLDLDFFQDYVIPNDYNPYNNWDVDFPSIRSEVEEAQAIQDYLYRGPTWFERGGFGGGGGGFGGRGFLIGPGRGGRIRVGGGGGGIRPRKKKKCKGRRRKGRDCDRVGRSSESDSGSSEPKATTPFYTTTTKPKTDCKNPDPDCGLQGYPRQYKSLNKFHVISTVTTHALAARTCCAECGWQLAEPINSDENLYISEKLMNGEPFWLGGSDAGLEGNWKWISGKDMTYRAWENGQPDNLGSGQDCLVGNVGRNKWTDESCSHTRYKFVCEIN